MPPLRVGTPNSFNFRASWRGPRRHIFIRSRSRGRSDSAYSWASALLRTARTAPCRPQTTPQVLAFSMPSFVLSLRFNGTPTSAHCYQVKVWGKMAGAHVTAGGAERPTQPDGVIQREYRNPLTRKDESRIQGDVQDPTSSADALFDTSHASYRSRSMITLRPIRIIAPASSRPLPRIVCPLLLVRDLA